MVLSLAALLALATVAVYWPVRGFDFSLYDDRPYIVWNERVRTGLSWANAAWALTTFHQANWHPLTWVSHMLDVELHGLDPGGHHLTSLGFHVANTVLLFALVRAMTGALWRSAALAALFGLHPLHVESVAWVAERKDVLSTFLLLATLGAYLRHARRPGRGRLALVALLLGLGLCAKPMLVTLPCALLLLDWWPLGRVRRPVTARGRRPEGRGWPPLVLEKLPLFALAAAASVVTIVAQRRGGALQTMEMIPPGQRLANAVASYGAYLLKTAWPAGLSAMYPFPAGGPPLWQVAAGAGALLAITWAVLRRRDTAPAAVTGWLWYLGTLVPVIGIVQVGSQAMADRYTYVPLVGFFLAAVWALGDAVGRHIRARAHAALALCLILAGFAFAARAQVGHWRDAATLNRRAIQVSGSDLDGLMREAAMQEAHGEFAAAEAAYRRVLAIGPDHPMALNNLGVLLFQQGRREEGLSMVRAAIRARPGYAEAHYNLGVLLGNEGRFAEAVAPLTEALRLKPDYADARALLRRLGVEPPVR